jgi:hypothetical protein
MTLRLESKLCAPKALAFDLRRCLRGAALASLLTALGCGGEDAERVPVFPVEGKLIFGSAIPAGAITLHPVASGNASALRPTALVAPDGSFKFTTYDQADGAPVGDYVLTAHWFKAVKQAGEVLPGRNVLPTKYGTPQTSGLEVSVAAGLNQLPPIQLR